MNMRSGLWPSPEGSRLLFAGTISPMICPGDGPKSVDTTRPDGRLNKKKKYTKRGRYRHTHNIIKPALPCPAGRPRTTLETPKKAETDMKSCQGSVRSAMEWLISMTTGLLHNPVCDLGDFEGVRPWPHQYGRRADVRTGRTTAHPSKSKQGTKWFSPSTAGILLFPMHTEKQDRWCQP